MLQESWVVLRAMQVIEVAPVVSSNFLAVLGKVKIILALIENYGS